MTFRKIRTPRDGGSTYPLKHRLVRLGWNLIWLVACGWTPRQFRPWRRLVLRAFGARMGANTDVYGSSRVWFPRNLIMKDGAVIGGHVEVYNTAAITLMEKALVSQGAYLCAGTHDYTRQDFPLVTRPITIGRNVWIGARAIVGPGVSIGDNVVLGAGAVAFKDLSADMVYAGNPAVRIKDRWPAEGSAT